MELAVFLTRIRNSEGRQYASFKQALAGFEKAYGKADYHLISPLTSAAANLMVQGKYRDAEPLYKRAVPIEEEFLASDPVIPTTLNNLAFALMRQGRYTEAEPLFKRAIALQQHSAIAVGGDHWYDKGDTMRNVAELLRQTNRSELAKQWRERAKQTDGR